MCIAHISSSISLEVEGKCAINSMNYEWYSVPSVSEILQGKTHICIAITFPLYTHHTQWTCRHGMSRGDSPILIHTGICVHVHVHACSVLTAIQWLNMVLTGYSLQHSVDVGGAY